MDREWLTLEEKMLGWRRDLHRIPELENTVPQTSLYIQNVLKELGIPFHTLMEGNAVVGRIDGKNTGKCVALRADMDGLPVKEETGLAFASTNGCMHACGHDGHMAMILGAAAWLQTHRDSFSGTVKLFFQPGEERPGGALPMIQEGCLENPHVDAVFGLHTGAISTELPAGKIGFRRGPIMAAVDIFQLTIRGKGGHGAYPYLTKDPVVAAAEIILAWQNLISRETKATDPTVLSVTQIQGGRTINVVPDEVVLCGTVRSVNPDTRSFLAGRMREVAEAVCAGRRMSCDLAYEFIYPALINDEEMSALARQAAVKIVGEDRVYDLEEPVMGGEDFAYYAQYRPAAYFFQYAMQAVDGEIYPHHAGAFDLDESRFLEGAQIHTQIVLDFLKKD